MILGYLSRLDALQGQHQQARRLVAPERWRLRQLRLLLQLNANHLGIDMDIDGWWFRIKWGDPSNMVG